MEAGALGRELDEHRDGAVRLRARRGEEAVGDLALHHHAPAARPSAGRRGSRRRSASRRCTAGSRRACAAAARARRGRARARRRSAARRSSSRRQVRLERAVELDGVHERDPVGEEARQDAAARADLEHDVVRRELGEPPDHAEDVLVDEEVLAELLLRRDVLTAGRSSARRSRRSARASSSASSPRASASAARVWTTFAGSFGRPRRGCGARYGQSVSARSRSAGTCARRRAELVRVLVRDVAGERDVPAALERRLEQRAATRSSAGRRCRRSRRARRACPRRRRACG